MRFLRDLVSAAFPATCGACGAPVPREEETPALVPLCQPCREALAPAPEGCPGCNRPVVDPSVPCPHCRADPPPFRTLSAVAIYGGSGRELVIRLKHGRRPDLARPLGTWMAVLAHRRGLAGPDTVVVPVGPWPPHTRQRGYSAPVLLAREVARRTGCRWLPDLLVRVRPPGDPHGDRRARANAVQDAWTLRCPRRVVGQPVLLVDDVVTTGATAREASRLLVEAGARQVDVLALARVD